MIPGRVMLASALVLIIGFLLAPYTQSAPIKKLMIAVGQEPTSMDPSLTYLIPDYIVTDNYAEYLLRKAPSGELEPGLATSWKVSPDGKEIEFALRKGVRFHSGDPLTMKDVEFSFKRALEKNATSRTRLKSMDRLQVIDDHRFKILLKARDITVILNRGCVPIVSKSYYDRVGEDGSLNNPVGTGPYKFVRYVPGQYVDLERFEGYWGEKPPVREARFYFIPEDATRVAKLKAGEVDIINSCPYPLVKDIENSPGLKVIRLATNHPTVAITFSTQNRQNPWYDRRVRLAMAYAIDCDTIVKKLLLGIPNRWAFLAPYEVGYDPDVKPYPYDPKKARELLAEAGYGQGFDLKFYWPITGRIPMVREVVEAIASYFEAVGIRTKLIGEEYAAAYTRRRALRKPDADYVSFYPGALSAGMDPTYNIERTFSSTGEFSSYFNPEVDKLNAQAKDTLDHNKRTEIVKKMVRILHEDVPIIPVFNMISVYAMSKNIDFNPTQKDFMDFLFVRDITIK